MSNPTLIPNWIENDLSLPLSMLFLLLLPLELLRRHRAGTLTRASLFELGASTSPMILTLMMSAWTLSFITALFLFAAQFAVWTIETSWLSALAAIVLVDFLYYIDHRCGHEIRLYWAVSHSVHHSSTQYDQSTGFRVSFIDGFLSPWFYLPAVLIGFNPLLVASALGFIIAYQQWLHTETIGKLSWLDPWLNTPSNHRVHHGSQPQYLDKNYGAVLMLWDQFFGTYAVEKEAVVFGITNPINSHNPVAVHLCELIRLVRDLRTSSSTRDWLAYLYQPPGWQPAHHAIALQPSECASGDGASVKNAER